MRALALRLHEALLIAGTFGLGVGLAFLVSPLI
jgi:hypothetical protein